MRREQALTVVGFTMPPHHAYVLLLSNFDLCPKLSSTDLLAPTGSPGLERFCPVGAFGHSVLQVLRGLLAGLFTRLFGLDDRDPLNGPVQAFPQLFHYAGR